MSLLKKKKPADHGALPHNTNDSLARIIESNDEKNNPLVQGKQDYNTEFHRQEGESAQAYNERVPIAIQPVQPLPTHDYLGRPLN